MALLFTVLCGGTALSLGYFINYFAKGNIVHSTEALLDAEIRYVEALGALPRDTENPEKIYLALNKDGRLPKQVPEPSKRLAEGILVFDFPQENKHFAAKIHTFAGGQKFLIGTDITEVSEDFRFMQGLGIASIIFVMIVVFASYLISVFVVSGTNKIADTAQEIIRTGNLSRRIEIGSRWDDLSNMAAVLNLLLNRIEELMQGVRQVSDNIAHDLRTPLTRMRSHVEALQKQDPKNTAYPQLLDETDHILATFSALLRISRIETERQRSQFKTVFLDDILKDVTEFYEPLAEEKNITLKIDLEKTNYYGDRNLLFQAFANLLDNAVKFTPRGGSISLALQSGDGPPCIVLSDTGHGVTEEEKEKIFERFYRGEKSRTSSGSGLGLSLVAAVVALHGGRIEVENTHPGLKIITIL